MTDIILVLKPEYQSIQETFNADDFDDPKEPRLPVLSTLNSSQIVICDRTLRELHFIAPNRAIIAAIVLSSPRLTSRIRSFYRGDYRESGVLETCERELLMDAFAWFYTGHPWPVYADDHNRSVMFFDEIMERTSQTGWVFTD